MEGHTSVQKSRRGAVSTRSKRSPQKSVASRTTSKKPSTRRGKSTRNKKAVEVQESVQEDQPVDEENADEAEMGEELNENLKGLHDEYDK